MNRRTLLAAALALAPVLPAAAVAQQSVDPALMDEGRVLFTRQCLVCHRPAVLGAVTVIPDLSGSELVPDLEFVVTAISEGLADMPPFYMLSDREVAAIATFVRNDRGHSHGGVTVEEVAAIRAGLDPPPAPVSVWDGVYTAEQASRGAALAVKPCGPCHGSRFDGVPDNMFMTAGPRLARAPFLRAWNGRSLGALFSLSHLTMPKDNPGRLPPEDYAAIVAYMLAASDVPPGDTPLPSDPIALGRFVIREKAGQ